MLSESESARRPSAHHARLFLVDQFSVLDAQYSIPIACRIDSGVYACAVTYVFLATATEQIILTSSAENTTWSSAGHDAQKVRFAP